MRNTMKICVVVLFGGTLLICLLIYAWGCDLFLTRSREAQCRLRERLATAATSNEYFREYGFFFSICYYRCDTTPEVIQVYVQDGGLLPVLDRQAIAKFHAGPPYWWNPSRGYDVEYYGRPTYSVSLDGQRYLKGDPKECVISFDKSTGRCHVRRGYGAF